MRPNHRQPHNARGYEAYDDRPNGFVFTPQGIFQAMADAFTGSRSAAAQVAPQARHRGRKRKTNDPVAIAVAQTKVAEDRQTRADISVCHFHVGKY